MGFEIVGFDFLFPPTLNNILLLLLIELNNILLLLSFAKKFEDTSTLIQYDRETTYFSGDVVSLLNNLYHWRINHVSKIVATHSKYMYIKIYYIYVDFYFSGFFQFWLFQL